MANDFWLDLCSKNHVYRIQNNYSSGKSSVPDFIPLFTDTPIPEPPKQAKTEPASPYMPEQPIFKLTHLDKAHDKVINDINDINDTNDINEMQEAPTSQDEMADPLTRMQNSLNQLLSGYNDIKQMLEFSPDDPKLIRAKYLLESRIKITKEALQKMGVTDFSDLELDDTPFGEDNDAKSNIDRIPDIKQLISDKKSIDEMLKENPNDPDLLARKNEIDEKIKLHEAKTGVQNNKSDVSSTSTSSDLNTTASVKANNPTDKPANSGESSHKTSSAHTTKPVVSGPSTDSASEKPPTTTTSDNIPQGENIHINTMQQILQELLENGYSNDEANSIAQQYYVYINNNIPQQKAIKGLEGYANLYSTIHDSQLSQENKNKLLELYNRYFIETKSADNATELALSELMQNL